MDYPFTRKVVVKNGLISPRRFKHIFLIGILFSTIFLFVKVSDNKDFNNSHHSIHVHLTVKDVYESDITDKSFTIKTEGCSIPLLKAMDSSIKQYVEYPEDIPQCYNATAMVIQHNKTHIWINKNLNIEENTENITCCYRSFYRPSYIDDINENVDNRVKYDDCINFSNVSKVNHEFIKVNCSVGNISVEEYLLFAKDKQFNPHDGRHDNLKSDAFNVLILGIDSVSRLNFFRTMPKTVKYLRNYDAVDLAGYNKVGDNTFPNLIPMLLGISDSETKTTCLPRSNAKFDNCPFIWEWFKQAGYYTALAEDSSWLGTFNYLKSGFSSTPTDYYTHTFINEAEKYAAKENFSMQLTSCLNNKYFYKVLLDYIEDVTLTLKDKKLFGFFWETTMTHDYLNYPMVMDDDYVNFLTRLETSGYLNNSIVFLLSDHGIRWGDIRYTKQGRLEERLPFVYVLVPPKFREKYSVAYRNLKFNSQRLTTPYDIHATLYDLTNLIYVQNKNILHRSAQSYLNNRGRGISLFLPIPSNRTCGLAGISDHWCACHRSITRSKRNKHVWRAALHLVKHLNAIVMNIVECMKLVLVDVIEANEMLVGKPENREVDSWLEFMVVVKTSPGDGVFEATLRGKNLRWDVVGTASRLNLYGNQSHCVNDNQLKLYCFCKDKLL